MSAPATIPEALFDTAGRDEGKFVFHLAEGEAELSCAELAERAARGARRLAALGVEPGDAVGLLGPNRPEWVVWAFAVWIAGATLVPIQKKLRIRDEGALTEQLRTLVRAAGCRLVLAEPALVRLLPDGLGVAWDEPGEESREAPLPPGPHDAAVIQFTSGSTAAPKGARLPHAAVLAQMEVLRDVYRHPDGNPRRVANWTPFFHDLGLFANLVHPAYSGATIHQLPTERFARDPAEWLRMIEASRATITVAPCSAFGSAVRAAGRRGEPIDLGSLEAALFAAEGVDPAVAHRMLEAAPSLGLRREALGSTYGQAEAVMAVAYSRVGAGLRGDRVAVEELAGQGLAVPAADGPVRELFSCGPPRMDVRIAGEDGSLPERQVGEIQVRGPSRMSGYAGVGDLPHPFQDGWLHTGDLGYLADGELFVTGRERDMVIVMGRNYYPEDFEWAAGRASGVRPGCCVAFSLPGSERVALLVEARGDPPAGFEGVVARTVADAVGVRPGEVVVLPPGTVEKTTSGKVRRATMRRAYAEGALLAVGR